MCLSSLKKPLLRRAHCRARDRRAVSETPTPELDTHEHGDGENGMLQDDGPLRCDTERARGPRYVVPDCGLFPDRMHPESSGRETCRCAKCVAERRNHASV